MAWTIEFAESASKALGKLDKPVSRRIIKFLRERVSNDPKAVGEALKGTLAPLWRYRVGDYHIINEISDETVKVIVLRIGHRKEVYK
jgi:mRNA interferase RelE/StbE